MTHNWNTSTVVTMMQLCQTADLIDGAEARPFYFGKCLNFSLRVSLLHFLRRQTGGEEVRKGTKDLQTEKGCGCYGGYFVCVFLVERCSSIA